MGLGAMSASALPSGYESVNVHGTLNIQNYSSTKGYFITKISVSNKDILGLVGDEFGTLASGDQLVSYGLYYGNYTDIFAVLDKNNNVVHSDVSTDTGSYELNMWFSEGSNWIYNHVPGTSDSENYQSSDGELYFSDYTGDNTFTMIGQGKDSVNWDNYNESYSINNMSGWFNMPMIDTGYNYGLITGSISGSGKDVYPFDY